MFAMQADQIGGAIVRRTFTSGGKHLVSGTKLTGDEVRRFPTANRMALIEKRYIDVFPVGGGEVEQGQRFVLSMGFGKFAVIEGKMLADGIDRETAYALAGKEAPAEKKPRAKKQAQ